MKKIIKNIVLVILIFVLGFVCYSRFIKKDYITKIFGKGFLVVITESMKPTISSGEFIVISEDDEYKKGEIITYIDEDGLLVTHRIEKITEEFFVAKGDNNNISDGEMQNSRICGKVIFHSKSIGFFVLYLLKPLVILYVIYLIVLEIILVFKVKENKNENESESEKDKDVIKNEQYKNKSKA